MTSRTTAVTRRGAPDTSGGFSLLEVLVALALLAGGALGLLQLFSYSGRATVQARRITTASALAAQKLDQLRSLTWGYDASGLPVGDGQTDTAARPERASGGQGLSLSPANTLDANTSGYCDFLDATGQLLGGGTTAPPEAAYVRRWAVRPLTADPADSLVIQVKLLSPGAADRAGGDPAAVTLTALRTRVMW
ncbi:MAG: prepilin-type N-terminal cleavage/methylation domain-containing protein [Vicinamibacterales bacterium]